MISSYYISALSFITKKRFKQFDLDMEMSEFKECFCRHTFYQSRFQNKADVFGIII